MILSLLLLMTIPAIAPPGLMLYDRIMRLTGKGGWHETRETVVSLCDYSGIGSFV